MTVSSPLAKAVHITHEAVTNYAFPFKVFKEQELTVCLVDASFQVVPLVPGVDYTVSGLGQDQGGTISLTAAGREAAGTGLSLVLLRRMDFTQETDYQPHDVFPAETHERALDILTMICQELREQVGRAMIAPPNASEPVQYADFVNLLAAAEAARDRAREEADRAGAAVGQAKAAKTQARCAVTAARKWAAHALHYSAEAARAAVEAVEAGSKIVPTTEEEYEALCPEEKMSGKWFVIYEVVAEEEEIGAAASLKILKLTHLGKGYELGPDIEIPTASPATETEPGQPGILALAALNDTTSDDKAATPAGVAAQVAAAPGGEHWESGWFDCAHNTAYSFNHNLNIAVERQKVRALWKVKTAQSGYAVGDILDLSCGNYYTNTTSNNWEMGWAFAQTANSILMSNGNTTRIASMLKTGGLGLLNREHLQAQIIVEG